MNIKVLVAFPLRNWREAKMMLHVCNLSIWETEAGGSSVHDSLDYIACPCLKKQKNNAEN
jgi:hypothetical protein